MGGRLPEPLCLERPRRSAPRRVEQQSQPPRALRPRAFPVGVAGGGARAHNRRKVGAAECGRPGKPVVLFAPLRVLGSKGAGPSLHWLWILAWIPVPLPSPGRPARPCVPLPFPGSLAAPAPLSPNTSCPTDFGTVFGGSDRSFLSKTLPRSARQAWNLLFWTWDICLKASRRLQVSSEAHPCSDLHSAHMQGSEPGTFLTPAHLHWQPPEGVLAGPLSQSHWHLGSPGVFQAEAFGWGHRWQTQPGG